MTKIGDKRINILTIRKIREINDNNNGMWIAHHYVSYIAYTKQPRVAKVDE